MLKWINYCFRFANTIVWHINCFRLFQRFKFLFWLFIFFFFLFICCRIYLVIWLKWGLKLGRWLKDLLWLGWRKLWLESWRFYFFCRFKWLEDKWFIPICLWQFNLYPFSLYLLKRWLKCCAELLHFFLFWLFQWLKSCNWLKTQTFYWF